MNAIGARTWTITYGSLLALAIGLYFLLVGQGHAGAARTVSGGLSTLAWGWLIFGVIRWWDVPWVAQVGRLIITLKAAAVLIWLFNTLGWEGAQAGVLATTLMLIATVGGLKLLRLTLRIGHPIVGIAGTLIDEAVRMKLVHIFLGTVFIGLPLLTLSHGSESRLAYSVQTFLSWSTLLIGFSLSLMTILLAARSISSEFDQKQVFFTLTKPVARWHYLVGKLLGLVLLNTVLLTVAGGGVYGFAQYMRTLDALDPLDELAVNDQTLAARQTVSPVPVDDSLLNDLLTRRVEALRNENPQRYGNPGDPLTNLNPNDVREIQSRVLANWSAVAPGQRKTFRFTGLEQAAQRNEAARQQLDQILADAGFDDQEGQDYLRALNQVMANFGVVIYPGLPLDEVERRLTVEADKRPLFKRLITRDGAIPLRTIADLLATSYQAPLQVRIVPEAAGRVEGGLIRLRFSVGPWPIPAPPMSEGDAHVINVPVYRIDDNGNLDLTIENPENLELPSITFEPGEGLMLLENAGTFAGNLARTLSVIWVRLVFLAVLGLGAGAVLSFPVAALLALLVYGVAAGSGFVAESLGNYTYFPDSQLPYRDQIALFWERLTTRFDEGEYGDVAKMFIGLIAQGAMLLIPSFADYHPGPLFAAGRQVPLAMITGAAVWLIGVWSIVFGGIAYLLFRRREAARVTL
ncbi:MAG: ABC transporter permease subunit [Planctomycetota bacterium]